MTLNNQPARVLWDTGAQFGYVTARRFTDGAPPRPGFTDFSPMFGDLDIPTAYTLPFTLAGHDLLEAVGPAPEIRGGGVSPVPMLAAYVATFLGYWIGAARPGGSANEQ